MLAIFKYLLKKIRSLCTKLYRLFKNKPVVLSSFANSQHLSEQRYVYQFKNMLDKELKHRPFVFKCKEKY